MLAAPATLAQPTGTLRLSALVGQINGVVNSAFAGKLFWVVADVQGHTFYASKRYHFFELVEKEAGASQPVVKMTTVAWGNGHDSIGIFESLTGQPFTNNLQVLVQVGVRHHKVHGLQLVLEQIDPNYTIGQLQQQREAVLARLCLDCADVVRKTKEGFASRNHGLRLKPILRRLAVISAHSSAGYQDFKHTLDTNPFGYRFQVTTFFTAVQGEAKAEKMQEQFVKIFHHGADAFDAVVLIRGGGSATDFLIFDTFIVGRVVAKFPLPVITGIGHQKNETIADLMAHTPLKTPTKVAEFIIAHNRRFEEELGALQQSIVLKAQQAQAEAQQALSRLQLRFQQGSHRLLQGHGKLLQQSREQLGLLAQRRVHHARQALAAEANSFVCAPREMVQKQRQALALRQQQIVLQSKTCLVHSRRRLAHFAAVMDLMGMDKWLARGFALVYQQEKLITQSAQIDPAQPLRIRWADGDLIVHMNPQKANG